MFADHIFDNLRIVMLYIHTPMSFTAWGIASSAVRPAQSTSSAVFERRLCSMVLRSLYKDHSLASCIGGAKLGPKTAKRPHAIQ